MVATKEIYGYQIAVGAAEEKNKGTKHISAEFDDPQLRQCPSGYTTGTRNSRRNFFYIRCNQK